MVWYAEVSRSDEKRFMIIKAQSREQATQIAVDFFRTAEVEITHMKFEII